MKKNTLLVALLTAFTASFFTSCADDEAGTRGPIFKTPTNQQFAELRQNALGNIKQQFTINTAQPYNTFTSAKGVNVTIYSGCLTKNGAPVTGTIDIEFTEIYERGNMAVANKTTMGLDGSTQKLLISGGEFYINATQGGVQVETSCGIQLTVPCSLTGGLDEDMLPWTGTVDAAGNVVWAQQFNDFWGGSEQGTQNAAYYAYLDDFGWFNCDKFAGFEGPMTEVEIIVPQGYNNTNSAVFIAIEGEPNTLGNLYGEYPVGLECHLIFVSSDGYGGWVYAIKSVTLTADASYTFTPEEFDTATEAEVVAAINAL